jgi:hypothetical protein
VDTLKRLEGKIDQALPLNNLTRGFKSPKSSLSSQSSFESEGMTGKSYNNGSNAGSHTSLGFLSADQPYRHASAAHKMLTWPAIKQLLSQSMGKNIGDTMGLEREGSAFIVRLHKGSPNLPLDELVLDQPFVGMHSQATRTTGGSCVAFPGLDYSTMLQLSTAYFDTFNGVYPFMDQQIFLQDTMARVWFEGFNGDTDSVIALLVFALGQLAIDDQRGSSGPSVNKRSSAIEGTSLVPSSLGLFNEARKRLGFVLTKCDLENVQIFSLAAYVLSRIRGAHDADMSH